MYFEAIFCIYLRKTGLYFIVLGQQNYYKKLHSAPSQAYLLLPFILNIDRQSTLKHENVVFLNLSFFCSMLSQNIILVVYT